MGNTVTVAHDAALSVSSSFSHNNSGKASSECPLHKEKNNNLFLHKNYEKKSSKECPIQHSNTGVLNVSFLIYCHKLNYLFYPL